MLAFHSNFNLNKKSSKVGKIQRYTHTIYQSCYFCSVGTTNKKQCNIIVNLIFRWNNCSHEFYLNIVSSYLPTRDRKKHNIAITSPFRNNKGKLSPLQETQTYKLCPPRETTYISITILINFFDYRSNKNIYFCYVLNRPGVAGAVL